ncbi:GreA/GreB family elongation factor [Marinomonas transparens]|uniref:GreA/GreB family elongation factor n=1 Tax=Marinomonas transparens TaxID=2795388 RepID=A0A934JQG2_9GAMM|nr:GreA/GreB family elongation factor [Marinomonas transparens]MBJ7538184.1 GreA/GreB family elongation factor [Marinomonas transparens]
MNKRRVKEAITNALLKRFETAKLAAQQAHGAATNEESVAENKYDTFGLEASYLAHGQSQRVLECEADWLIYDRKECIGLESDAAIGIWTLVELQLLNLTTPSSKYFFVSPCAGGLTVKVGEQSIYLVTTSSPVGKKLIGKNIGDEITLLQGGVQIDYEVVAVS